MGTITKLLAATALASVLSSAAFAKTLVYCSEASPANFDPGITTGGNDFDASSRTIYSRLVEFVHGGTTLEPGLADTLSREVQQAVRAQEMRGEPTVLLAPDALRQALARLLRRGLPQLRILAHSEIPDNRSIRVTTLVGAHS